VTPVKGGLEVVAADGAVEVEEFAGDKQIGEDLALHRPMLRICTDDPSRKWFSF